MSKTLGILAAALVLAACAAQPGTSPSTSTNASTNGSTNASTVARVGDEGAIQTGSRLRNKGTDRIVRTIDSETYKNDEASLMRSIGNITGARGN